MVVNGRTFHFYIGFQRVEIHKQEVLSAYRLRENYGKAW